MIPAINKNKLRFIDLWPLYDNVPTEIPLESVTDEESWLRSVREGFKQSWESPNNPFVNTVGITEEDVRSTYYRLGDKYYSQVFIRANDEMWCKIGVFRIIADYLPNLRRRLDILEAKYSESIRSLQSKESRTSASNNKSVGKSVDGGYENQVVNPNTTATVSAPIIDSPAAQLNRNLTQDSDSTSDSTSNSSVLGDLGTAYDTKMSAIVDGLWESFIDRFDVLFTYSTKGFDDTLYFNNYDNNGNLIPTPIFNFGGVSSGLKIEDVQAMINANETRIIELITQYGGSGGITEDQIRAIIESYGFVQGGIA